MQYMNIKNSEAEKTTLSPKVRGKSAQPHAKALAASNTMNRKEAEVAQSPFLVSNLVLL